MQIYQTAIAQSTNYEALVKKFEGQGGFVAPEDQAINMMRTIQSQSAQSGVSIPNFSHTMTHTNEFFTEQTQNINVSATDSQLVDFLYKLGNDASMVRVHRPGIAARRAATASHLPTSVSSPATRKI